MKFFKRIIKMSFFILVLFACNAPAMDKLLMRLQQASPEYYQLIRNIDSISLYQAIEIIKTLRNKDKPQVDALTKEIIQALSQHFNVDPLIPAFYLGTPDSKEIYKQRLNSIQNINQALEQALSRTADSKELETLVTQLVNKGAKISQEEIDLRAPNWLENVKAMKALQPRQITFLESLVKERLQQLKTHLGPNFVVRNAVINTTDQKILVSVSIINQTEPDIIKYIAIIEINLTTLQSQQPMVFSLPGREAGYSIIAIFPQLDSKKYLILLKDPKTKNIKALYLDPENRMRW